MRTFKTLAIVAIIVSLFGFNQTTNAMTFNVNAGIGPADSTSMTGYTGAGMFYFMGWPYPNDLNTSPAAYAFLGDTVDATDFIVSENPSTHDTTGGGFYSWRGQANPTGAFSQELGNRLYLVGTTITSDTLISLDKVTVSITSAPNPILSQVVFFGDGAHGYATGFVQGIQWVNGQGGGDDIYVSGDPSQGVNEIQFILGPGNGVSALGAAGSTSQEKLDTTRDFILANIHTITFTVSYDHGGGNIESASKVLTVNGSVPEPTSIALFGIGVVALIARRRFQTM